MRVIDRLFRDGGLPRRVEMAIGAGMFHIVLVAPEIPHNAGAAGRLALATDSVLHLVRPLGFSLDDKHVKRSGLDYWPQVKLQLWDTLAQLSAEIDPAAKIWMCSTKAERTIWDAPFCAGDYLVFGAESRGLPEAWIDAAGAHALRIPMAPGGTRSLNLGAAVGIVLYEALRRQAPQW